MLAMATTLPTTNSNKDHKLKPLATALPMVKPNVKSSSSISTDSVNISSNNISSKPTIPLAHFHQSFVSPTPTPTPPMTFSPSSQNNHVTLPPISSFDNLIRAAEKQYSNNTNTNNNSITTPVNGTSPTFLSYQLSSAETACNTTVPRSIGQRPSSVVSSASSNSSSFSPTASISMTSPSLDKSMSPLLSTPHSNHTTAKNDILTTHQYTSKVHKPRKKKECPICHNFYANLSTHKSTHLTPENRPHKCPICQRGFARNNDLIRHKKRHWKDEIIENSSVENSDADDHDPHHHHQIQQLDEHDQLRSLHQIKGTFKCPFNSSLIQLDMEIYPYKSKPLNFETSNCHQTGVFSRCDTFKNHLKALHFEYPPGTKKRDRSVVPGRCKHCGLKFPNVDVWLNEHVGKTCGYNYH